MTENLFAPHEGREDVLLLAWRKPVAMFTLLGVNPRKEAQLRRLDAATAQGLVLRADFLLPPGIAGGDGRSHGHLPPP